MKPRVDMNGQVWRTNYAEIHTDHNTRSFEETFKDAQGKALNVRKVYVSADGKQPRFVHNGIFDSGQGHRVIIFRRME